MSKVLMCVLRLAVVYLEMQVTLMWLKMWLMNPVVAVGLLKLA